jgi:CubicO group peptidase (beta-lactamase class C family)
MRRSIRHSQATRMDQQLRAFVAIVVVLGVFCLQSALVTHTNAYSMAFQSAPDGAIVGRVDEYATALVRAGRFSGSLLVARDGRVLLEKSYGMANVELGVPNSSDTKFRIASITKQFTASAVMLLQQRGMLSVDDTVCTFVPECPATWKPLTLHHLMSNTSGIPNTQEFSDNAQFERMSVSIQDTVARFKARPLQFQPGTEMRYSSSGFMLLGFIIERVTGKRYEDFMREELFVPLSMLDTGYDHPRTILRNRADGYERTVAGILNATYFEMDTPHAAGALYSTVRDLFKWDQALYNGTILSKRSVEAMTTPNKREYGYGWQVTRRLGPLLQTHSGGISGFSTFIARYPEQRVTIVALANIEGLDTIRLRQDLAAIIFGGEYVLPSVRTHQFCISGAGIEGTFRAVNNDIYTYSDVVQLKRDGIDLLLEMDGQGYRVFCESSDRLYTFSPFEIDIRLVRDSSKRVTGLVISEDVIYNKTN